MASHKEIVSETGKQMLQQVRGICIGFPEVKEHVDGFGHTSFRVKDKPFVIMGENEQGTSLAIKTLPETQEILLQEERFFRPAYIGQHGWTSIYHSGGVNWKEIHSLILEAYQRTAPKRLVKLLEENQ
ncbi:MmcQ/YjbR family DNA-binding protein [Fictibacillus sp. B-59209]|uniref:MmcQ/YjbR family DNA-binding protein n=1 Tax=Fictibacillus sp. B-59209 TaxID=3024873 RepID=UPI002E1B8803